MRKNYLFLLLLLAVIGGLFLFSIVNRKSQLSVVPQTLQITPTQVPAASPSAAFKTGQRKKTTGCASASGLPDQGCTPGAIFSNATKEAVCTPGYSKSVRDVPEGIKDEVFLEYGITFHQPGEYEVDHLISLELGGSNDIANLWPEAGEPKPGFHEKDRVENFLHQQLCGNRISLEQAQQQISTDWLKLLNQLPL